MNPTNESECETQRRDLESRTLAERNQLSIQRVGCRQSTSRVQLFSILWCNLWNELNPENRTYFEERCKQIQRKISINSKAKLTAFIRSLPLRNPIEIKEISI